MVDNSLFLKLSATVEGSGAESSSRRLIQQNLTTAKIDHSEQCRNANGLFLGLERKHTSFAPRARMHLEQDKLVRSQNSQNSAGRCTLEPFWVENSCF